MFGTEEPGAVHRVRLTAFDRFQQGGVLGRVVFQIRILNQNYIAPGLMKSGPQGRPFAHVFFMQDNLHRGR